MIDVKRPMEGVRIWENQKNKFTVFELHFSADEDKRSQEWIESARAGMPRRQFLQEYQLEWLSYDGIPVYGDWNKKIHGSEFTREAHIGLPLLMGWDFGLNAACVVAQLQGDTLVVLKEFTAMNMGAQRFCSWIIPQLKQLWPQWSFRQDYLAFVDPSGFFRKDTDEGTCAQVLRDKGFQPRPGPVNWEERRMAVENWLCRISKSGPALQVNIDECPMLVKGFDGGYRYPQKAAEIEQSVLSPIKNMYSHIHDGFQYLCWGVSSVQYRQRRTQVPVPQYGQKT